MGSMSAAVRDKLNAPELVRMMVGRPLSDLFNKERDIPAASRACGSRI